ncbi:MAG: T9SS type A sorting domain-containing protein [Crocinitomicaceae bacterium]
MRVFPNPTSDEITIAFPTPVDQPVKIDLMDGTGRLIRTLTKNVQQQEVELSLADLPAGCYLLKMNEYQVHQIIKQ